MKQMQSALWAEWLKNKHTSIRWISVLAFALAPLMGGLLMHLLRHPAAPGGASPLQLKAQMLSFSADWPSYLSVLSQAVGVGGVLLFGFVASWLFGREYAEGTAKRPAGLAYLPDDHPPGQVHQAMAFGAAGLATFNFLFGLLIGTLLGLPGWSSATLQGASEALRRYHPAYRCLRHPHCLAGPHRKRLPGSFGMGSPHPGTGPDRGRPRPGRLFSLGGSRGCTVAPAGD
jgi:ABC-2 type transport system permease protein